MFLVRSLDDGKLFQEVYKKGGYLAQQLKLKTLPGMSVSHIGVPGFESWLHSQLRLLVNAHSGRQ